MQPPNTFFDGRRWVSWDGRYYWDGQTWRPKQGSARPWIIAGVAGGLVVLVLLGAVTVFTFLGIGRLGGTAQTKSVQVASAPDAATPASGAVPWSAPPDPMGLAAQAGLTPTSGETLSYHVHAHLDVFVNGRQVTVPAAIGIDTGAPGVQSFSGSSGTAYGLTSRCPRPCISPLHTHDASGMIHIEAPGQRTFRMSQFFTEWGVRLDAGCAGGYCAPASRVQLLVDGKAVTGDPAQATLTPYSEIALVIGSAPARVPASYDFSGL